MHEHIRNTQPRIVKRPEYLNAMPTLKRGYIPAIPREPMHSTHNQPILLFYIVF